MTAVLAAVICALAYQPAARVHQPARPALFARTVPLVRTSLPRASPSALLDVRGLALASALPSLLGLWKREYTVSYGYGGAMALAGALALAPSVGAPPPTPLAVAHAVLYIMYGIRLCAFLLYRELQIPYFRELRERVEARAPDGSRLKRLPFCLSCGLLYYCMAAPLALTSGPLGARAGGAVALALALALVGLAVAAIGDAQKTLAKAQGAGLVTGGLFAFLRHPNYTGEALLWLMSTLAAAAAALGGGGAGRLATVGWLGASAVGCAGIQFVLAQATTGLERRQRDKYGVNPDYEQWARRAWPGPMLTRIPARPSSDGA